MKINLSYLVLSMQNKAKKDEWVNIIGLDSEGKNFRISYCYNDGSDQEELLIGKLLPKGIFDIKEIIYDSAQITDVLADNDEDIKEMLEISYGIGSDHFLLHISNFEKFLAKRYF